MAWFAWSLFALGLLLQCPAVATAGQASRSAVGQTVELDGMSLYFEETGQGDPLVLLHGHGGCSSDWEPFADVLAARFRVVMPHMRGHGQSTNPGGAFTHRQSASDMFALLDRLGIDRFRAIGISSGGMTLLHMATRQPERIEAMVLVGAADHFPEQARKLTRRAAEHGPTGSELDYYGRCATRGDQQVRELAAQFAGFSRSFDDVDFPAPLLATIQARTLIVHGDRDEFFPVEIPLTMYAAIPDSALWIVPRGPHVPIFGQREREFLDVVLPFLQEAEPQPR
jgi:pimeloyl-ACP methyl ester carboxylesterase